MGGEGGMPGVGTALGRPPEVDAAFARRYGREGLGRTPRMEEPPGHGAPPPPSPPPDGVVPVPGQAGASTNGTITLQFRGVSLTQVSSSANTDIAYAVENELKACPLFEAKDTQLSPQINVDETNGTFTFGVTLALKRPLKL